MNALSLDSCSRQELKRLARYATPAQIAETRARIAAEIAAREDEDRRLALAASIDAARRVKAHFAAHGADAAYRILFADALAAARRAKNAEKRAIRYRMAAGRLARAARLAAREDGR